MTTRFDSFHWMPKARVEKFGQEETEWVARESGLLAPSADVFSALGVKPYETVEVEGNLLTTAGLTRLTALLIASGSPQAVTSTSARIGVGNSSTAEAVGQTDLQAAAGSSNRQFKVMDATYPQVSAGVVTLKSTFATGEANFVWAEWGVDIKNSPPAADGTTVNDVLLNRKVAALGTKATGTWALTCTITFS